MSPFWPDGRPLHVIAPAGCPQELRWGWGIHRVQQVSDHWRVHVGWWAEEVWRDYWEVTTHSGLLCVLYRDLIKDTWHLERIYA